MRAALVVCLVLVTTDLPSTPPCDAQLAAVRSPVLLPIEAPQDLDLDASDDSLWVCFGLSLRLVRISADLARRDVVETDLPRLPDAVFDGLTGLAYYAPADTLLVVRPLAKSIHEVTKSGTPTGRVLQLDLPRPPNIVPEPFPKGMAFNPLGDAGRGSLWLVEGVMTAIYEVNLAGDVIGSFCHPDDPDGCPGLGRSAAASDVALAPAGTGDSLEIAGGGARRDAIHRLDASFAATGLSYPLAEVGGVPAGFLRGSYRSAPGQPARPVLYVLVESSAELHVLAVEDPGILPLRDPACTATLAEPRAVELTWRGSQDYKGIEVRRDGAAIAQLPGDAVSFLDEAPISGVVEYEIVASAGGCETRAVCESLSGAGVVLQSLYLDGRHAVDLAEDATERLWVTFADNVIDVYDKDLALLTALPSPFQAKGDVTSGIDYNPAADTFYVYNQGNHTVAALDSAGEVVEGPFPSGVVADPATEEALVPSLLYNPSGNGGDGSFWYVDLVSGTIEEHARDGSLLHACIHPDNVAEPPPAESGFGAFAFGLTTVPGRGFDLLEMTGGRIRDLEATRVLRIETATCLPAGGEVPLAGVALIRTPFAIGLHRTAHGGAPRIYAIVSRSRGSWILELDASPPPVPFVGDLRCTQPGQDRDVLLDFNNPGGIETLEVRRDGEVVGVLPGSEQSFVDRGVPAGVREYSVRGSAAGDAGAAPRCRIQVGAGSVAARVFAYPAAFLHTLAFDPIEQRYVAASTANHMRSLQLFDLELRRQGELPTPFGPQFQVAAAAVRVAQGRSEVYCLGWVPGAVPGVNPVFPIAVLDRTGRVVRDLQVEIPQPRSIFVTFPSALAWDAATDSFFCLERNSTNVYRFGADGDSLGSFVHPQPLHQDNVINYGLAIDPGRGVLYLSGAGRGDVAITKLVELTRSGKLTGVEVPLDAAMYDKSWGFSLAADARGFVVAAGVPGPWDLLRVRAFDDLEPVADLACTEVSERVEIRWQNAAVYDDLAVFRGLDEAALLAGSSTSWRDPEEAPPGTFYRVVGHQGDRESPGAVCEPAIERRFVRGAVQGQNGIDLSDAVSILGFLFLGGRMPPCLDAADIDDNGRLEVSDPVRLLNFLFLGGPPPAPPYPLPARDPTPDPLTCQGE